MNTPNENHSSLIEEKIERGYLVTVRHDCIRVINIYVGTKSASKVIYNATIKKILYDTEDIL